jgi:hypothetical protein
VRDRLATTTCCAEHDSIHPDICLVCTCRYICANLARLQR